MPDSPRFEFEYPLYVLRNEAESVFYVTGPKGNFLPIFTDHDTADQFLEARPQEGWTPAPVENRDELLDILWSASGVQFVTFDPASTGKRAAPAFPITACIASLTAN